MIELILSRAKEEPLPGSIFPSSFQVHPTWRKEWLRKLNMSAFREGHDIVVEPRHTLTMDRPAADRIHLSRTFVGLSHLVRGPCLQTHDGVKAIGRVRLDARLVDHQLLLDGTIRLMPALGIRHRLVLLPKLTLDFDDQDNMMIVECPDMVLPSEIEDQLGAGDSVHLVTANQVVVSKRHTLVSLGLTGPDVFFRDAYTALVLTPKLLLADNHLALVSLEPQE